MKTQRGLSLMSTLIGLLLASITLLAMLVLYRGTVRQTVGDNGSIRRASRDVQLDEALMTGSMKLQNAGYGLPAAKAGSDVVVLNGVTFTNGTTLDYAGNPLQTGRSPSGNAILWRVRGGNTTICQGLVAPADGNLWFLQTATDCSLGSAWNTIGWTPLPLLTGNTSVAASQAAVFALSESACWPYNSNAAAAPAGIRATITLRDPVAGDVAHGVCLVNLTGWTP
ncbi:hypothetical protein [Paludibacterium paludis]|uniref:Uncharacterized protein n=1 Tax=Paludibacterium paludis TaxID=1225769 RepID=A0A918P3Y9_9NEIS|nr:hypothetical protein [Paludibacterium paludis]GGY17635.1 hypothetical protein GCM10011289_21410 [Paludibacterium paludis]